MRQTDDCADLDRFVRRRTGFIDVDEAEVSQLVNLWCTLHNIVIHPCFSTSLPDSLNQFTSIFCLMVMSIDRYLAVVHPIRSTKWRKPRFAKIINLTVWGVSLIVILPTMIFSGLNEVPVCGIVWPEPQDIYYKAFIFYTFFIGFFLPLSVICLCYLLIIIKVRSPLSTVLWPYLWP